VRYLEAQLRSVSTDPYALSIITYALSLAGSSQANAALQQLNTLAVNKGLPTTFALPCHCDRHACCLSDVSDVLLTLTLILIET